MDDTGRRSVDLSAVLVTGDPAVGLRAVPASRRLAGRVEAQQVALALAREQGWSVGVTRQSTYTTSGKGPR